MNKAIVILAGGFTRDASGEWHSSTFGTPATVSMSGSYVRIAAAAILWRQNPDSVVVPSGGRGQADQLFPPGLFLSTVMRRELIQEGVPATSILEENRSGNTLEQLREIRHLAKVHGWPLVEIVSSRFHLPRIQAMIECLSELGGLKSITQFTSAEDVVLAASPVVWRSAINLAYASPEFIKLAELEANGVRQLREGTYRVT
ncbi:MAG: YdcF family protein [Patescibacteria group bacterium]